MPGSSPGMTSGDACTSTSISNSSRLRTRFRDLAECFFREVFIYSRPLRIEGAGNAGRSMRPRSRVQDVIESAHEHTGHTGITRHSPRNGFNGYSVISPVLRAFWPPSPALLLADLTPASGCQDHTTSHVRGKSPFVIGASASTASRPAAVTIATRPSVGRDEVNIAVICTSEKQNIFSQ